MAAIYALESLFDAVKPAIEASWTLRGDKRVQVEWGQTRVPMKINQGTIGRVLFVPGNVDGDMGDLGSAKQWEHPAKALLDLGEMFQVYCFGHNPAAESTSDRSHDRAAWQVLHEAIRQIRLASQQWDAVTSPVRFGKVKLLKPMSVSTRGREYLLNCTIEQPILDMFDDTLPLTDVSPGIAEIGDTLGNETETSTTTLESD
jgi:hypothetical protein